MMHSICETNISYLNKGPGNKRQHMGRERCTLQKENKRSPTCSYNNLCCMAAAFIFLLSPRKLQPLGSPNK